MLLFGYLYFVIFFCLIRLDIKVSIFICLINIRIMIISLLLFFKVGVRFRFEFIVLSVEVYLKINVIIEVCGFRMFKLKIFVKIISR